MYSERFSDFHQFLSRGGLLSLGGISSQHGHLERVIPEDGAYLRARPHQSMEQKIPQGFALIPVPEKQRKAKRIALPILNGLHHDYRLAARVTRRHLNGDRQGFQPRELHRVVVHGAGDRRRRH